MECICVLYILFICIANAVPGSPQPPKSSTLKSIPVVDALILRLEGEQWTDDEACLGATLQILHGVKNDTLWATWVWDSMQPPLGVFYGNGLNIGSYDQCLRSPWAQHEFKTQYCLVEVKMQDPMEYRQFDAYDSADEYLNTLSESGRAFNHLAFAVCMPAECSPSSIVKIFRHMLQLTHLPDSELIAVDPGDCQTAEQKPYPGKYYAFLSVLGVLLGFVVLSTTYVCLNDDKGNSTTDAITRSFCMVHNWNDLFKVNKNEIRVIHGMRFLTAVLVVACHQILFSLHNPSLLINSLDLDEAMKTEAGQAFAHIDLIVDTFFAMSGLLLVKGLMSGKQRNLLIVLLKRYCRLMGPVAVITFYIMCMAQHTTTGPVWLKGNANEEGVCENHWWKNFFMISNDFKTMCFGVGWYVSCDYHLAILTVILYGIYRRSRKSGVLAFAVASCALTVQLAVMAYRKRLPLVPFSNISKMGNIREYDLMNEYYVKWYDRSGSYMVGVVMGWLMATYKPAEHRNTFSQTVSIVIALASLYVMYLVATINHWFDSGSVAVAIAIATNRTVWAIAICALIGACEYGSVPVISDYLGSAFFVPLSKLSYGIYMTHFFLLQRNLHAVRSPLAFDAYQMTICVLGTTVMACAVSLALYILVEAPCINISNLCFSERYIRNNKAELNSTKSTNGSAYQNGNTKSKEI